MTENSNSNAMPDWEHLTKSTTNLEAALLAFVSSGLALTMARSVGCCAVLCREVACRVVKWRSV